MKLSTGSIGLLSRVSSAGQVPLAVRGTPAIADLTLGRARLTALGVE